MDILYPEGEILNILSALSPLEWRVYQHRYKERFGKKIDNSAYPPFVSFRFKNENPEIIQILKKTVNNFDGQLKWHIFEHKRIHSLSGINRAIEPYRMFEINDLAHKENLFSGEYLAKYEPELGPIAYSDLEQLTEDIRKALALYPKINNE